MLMLNSLKQFGRTSLITFLASNVKVRGFSNAVSEVDHKTALQRIGEDLGVQSLEDWYRVSVKQVQQKMREWSSLQEYKSLYKALHKLYPQHDWDPTRFSDLPYGFWSDASLRRKALEKVGIRLGVKELDDWYSIDPKVVKKELKFISNHHQNSLFLTLKELYPEHDWSPFKFPKVPRKYWNDTNSQRGALEKLGIRLGVKELDDWYKVDPKVVKSELSFISFYYKNSFQHALQQLYPNHEWNPLRFVKVPQRYWNSIDTQRDALETIGTKLGVKELDDWYTVDRKTVTTELGFIINRYQGSLYHVLKKLYPQHEWDPLKFSSAPHRYWRQPDTSKYFRALFVKWRREHKIRRMRDWYQLPPEKVKLFQRAAQRIFGSVNNMLKTWFPKTKWIDEIQGSTPELEIQMMLQLVVDDIKLHHRIGKHSVDIFIPGWNVAIEYQGLQHFQKSWRGDFSSQRQRDAEKIEYMLQQEVPISLVRINYRWNGTWSQLRSTIKSVCSDVLKILSLDTWQLFIAENDSLDRGHEFVEFWKFFNLPATETNSVLAGCRGL